MKVYLIITDTEETPKIGFDNPCKIAVEVIPFGPGSNLKLLSEYIKNRLLAALEAFTLPKE